MLSSILGGGSGGGLLGNVLGSVISNGMGLGFVDNVVGHSTIDKAALEGIWIYAEPGCAFTSQSLAGSELAVKQKLSSAFNTLGIKSENAVEFLQDGEGTHNVYDAVASASSSDTGAEIISYGAPVLPGAMFLLSYLTVENKDGEGSAEKRRIPVLGLPGCIMYAKRTIFDLVLPRVLAGERLTNEDPSDYGEGGLCLSCEVCHFPNCRFGR